MGSKIAQTIADTHNNLLNLKAMWLSTWQEIADFVIPRKNRIVSSGTSGQKTLPDTLFDSTAIHANELLASSLQGAFSMSLPFLVFENEELNEDEDNIEWLSECTKRMRKAFIMSNYRTESHEQFLDLTSIGTGCTLTEEKKLKSSNFNGVYFLTLSPADYCIDEDVEGNVDTVYRTMNFSARQAIQMFGEKAGKIALKAVGKEPNKIIKYIHAVFPGEEATFKIPGNKHYASIVIEPEESEVIMIRGYNEFPYSVPRWSKASGEVYGRSPAYNALPDIKCLNKLKELGLSALAIDVWPPIGVPDILGMINLQPGQQVPMRADLIDKIKPLLSNARHDVVQLNIVDLQDSIRKTFFTDQLQIQKQAQMTATEANITYELMQRLLGPAFGRIEGEKSQIETNRVFGIMYRSGAFPAPPSDIQPEDIKVDYVGPLIKAQKHAEAKSAKEWMEIIVALASVDPNVLDVPNLDVYIKDLGRTLGVPEKYINKDKIIKAIREERAASEAMKEEQELMLEGARVLPGAAKAIGMTGEAA